MSDQDLSAIEEEKKRIAAAIAAKKKALATPSNTQADVTATSLASTEEEKAELARKIAAKKEQLASAVSPRGGRGHDGARVLLSSLSTCLTRSVH